MVSGAGECAVGIEWGVCGDAGQELLVEDLGAQLAAAARAGLLEDRFEMVLDRPGRQEEALGECLRGQPARDQRGDLALAVGYAVGLETQRCRSFVRRALDDDRHALGSGAVRKGGVEREPACAGE